jgi:hypothetical protein
VITDRDREMLNFVDNYGCITIHQAELMFYKNTNFGYDLARKRLNYLVNIDWLKSYRDKASNLKVFYNDKKYTYHRILALDYYANLVSLGAEMSFFKTEFEWVNGKIRSDAFVGFIFNNKPYWQFVEVITSHNDLNLEKYETLYDTGEVQKLCLGKFPPVILIDNVNRKKDIELQKTKIIKLDFKLNDVAKVLLE